MKVSFLVTYYNQREYVKTSLDSILAIEKPCDWEIIIGDDGSTDGTIEEVEKYINQYPANISMYVMPREQGKKYDAVKRASANRLNILERSTGDLFCTLDGDDYFCDKTFIKEALEIFDREKEITLVTFGFRYVKNGVLENELLLPESLTGKVLDKKTYLESFYLPAGGCVHKKCFDVDRIEYIRKLGYFDDNDIVVNTLNYGEMYVVNRAIYAYRQTGQSVYTSMNTLEQAVLNVQGMDMDIRLVDESLKDSIIKRFGIDFITMYIWKRRIKGIIGEDKYSKYIENCSTLMPSYCYDILMYSSIDATKKKELKKTYKKVATNFKKFTRYRKLNYYLRNINN